MQTSRTGALLGLLIGTGVSAAPQLTIGHGSGDGSIPSAVPVAFSSDVPAVAVQFDVVFDPTHLTSSDPILTALSADHLLISSEPSPGTRRIVVYSTINAGIPNGPLVTLAFAPLPRAVNGKVTLTPANPIVASADAQPQAPITLIAGDFMVGALVSPQLRLTTLSPAGGVQLQLTGPVGATFLLQVSQDLIQWAPLKTDVIPAAGVLNFSDTVSTGITSRFYRAVQQ
jgi:hypothetical protein